MIHGSVENERTIMVSTGTPGQELWIINGTCIFDFSSDGQSKRDQVTFEVGPGLAPMTTFIDVTVTGAPTSFSMEHGPFALALDGIQAEPSDTGRIVVTGDVFLLGIAGFWRIGYQVQALVRRVSDASS